MRMPPELAALRVRAALGREPMDNLEAAVVLETWGVSTPHALAVAGPGREFQGDGLPPAPPPWEDEEAGPGRWTSVWLCLAVLAAVAWTETVVVRLSAHDARTAWRAALPTAFFLQWFVRRRYLTGPTGLARLRGDRTARWWLPLTVLVAVAALLASEVTAVAAGFTLVWALAVVLVHRGWGGVYVAALLVGAALTHRDRDMLPRTAVVLEVLLVLGLLAVAVARERGPANVPHRALRAAASGGVGGLIGALVAILPLPVQTSSQLAALLAALVPQLVGSVAWFAVLDRFWPMLRDGAGRIALTPGRPRLSRPARRLLVVAVAAYVGATVAASLVLDVVAGLNDGRWEPSTTTLVEFGAVGLAGVTFGSLDALGRTGPALAVTAATVASSAVAVRVSPPGDHLAVLLAIVTTGAALGYLLLHLLLGEPERIHAQSF